MYMCVCVYGSGSFSKKWTKKERMLGKEEIVRKEKGRMGNACVCVCVWMWIWIWIFFKMNHEGTDVR